MRFLVTFQLLCCFLLCWWWRVFALGWWCFDVCNVSVSRRNNNTFCLREKCLGMNILCTLAYLCEEILLQPLRLLFLLIFPSHPRLIFLWTTLTIAISHFLRAEQQNKGKGAAAINMIHSPTIPPPQHPPPPHYHLCLYKIICRTPMEERFPCVAQNFSVQSPFPPSLLPWPNPAIPPPWCGIIPNGKPRWWGDFREFG